MVQPSDGRSNLEGPPALVRGQPLSLKASSIRSYLELWGPDCHGGFDPDVYSTAWVALVPDVNDPSRPAWPQTLQWLRDHQLPDGGWGEPSVLYAHERTVSTLAAMRALATWHEREDDKARILRGLQALWVYGPLLSQEPCETIGFELILPRLWEDCAEMFDNLPSEHWAHVEELGRMKRRLIVTMQPKARNEATWWFSLEMLPETGLSLLEDDMLTVEGSVATSISSTAAYLWARRRAGFNSEPAWRYLDRLVQGGDGGVAVAAPVDTFERVWVLDNLRRGGLRPDSVLAREILGRLRRAWAMDSPGLGLSELFTVNDCDDTAVGTLLFWWAGMAVSDQPMIDFWDTDHFRSYLDERGASVSVNIHTLTALRMQPGFPHRDKADKVTGWLMDRMGSDGVFADKWQLSPIYCTSRSIAVFCRDNWCPVGADRGIELLRTTQRDSGGWGWFNNEGTLEETALAVLGLGAAFDYGRLDDWRALERAADYLLANMGTGGHEALWIGKTLYRSNAIVGATVDGALRKLSKLFREHRQDNLRTADALESAMAGAA